MAKSSSFQAGGSISSQKAHARLFLHETVDLVLETAVPVRLTILKAKAFMAILALEDTHAVSRQRLAGLLWSGLEPVVGLARLRTLLSSLQKSLNGCPTLLLLKQDIVSLNTDVVEIQVFEPEDIPEKASPWSRLLIDLQGVDPALDRWLAYSRRKLYERRFQPQDEKLGEFQPSLIKQSDKPSVVITELDVSGPFSAGYHGRVMAGELGNLFARSRWFSTITRGSLGERVSTGRQNLSQLADYALVGDMQCSKNRTRLLVKLIDLRRFGHIVWSSQFESHERLNLEVSLHLACMVAACFETELLLVEVQGQRATNRSPRSGAYALVLQAISSIFRLEQASFLDAGHLLERAVQEDRESAMAHGWLAYWHIFFVGQGWATNPRQSLDRAAWAAERAMLLDPKDARATSICGHVKAFLHHRLEEATAMHELALQLNPALALAWHLAGMTHAYAGRLDDALEYVRYSRKLTPNDPQGFFSEAALGILHLLRHEHEEAVNYGRRVTERQPNFTSGYKSYLAALGHLGRRSEAKEVLERLLRLEPRFSLQRFRASAPYRDTQNLEHFTMGLRLAGLR